MSKYLGRSVQSGFVCLMCYIYLCMLMVCQGGSHATGSRCNLTVTKRGSHCSQHSCVSNRQNWILPLDHGLLGDMIPWHLPSMCTVCEILGISMAAITFPNSGEPQFSILCRTSLLSSRPTLLIAMGTRSPYEKAATRGGQTQTPIHWFFSLGCLPHLPSNQQEWRKWEAEFRLLPNKGTWATKQPTSIGQRKIRQTGTQVAEGCDC